MQSCFLSLRGERMIAIDMRLLQSALRIHVCPSFFDNMHNYEDFEIGWLLETAFNIINTNVII